MLVVGHSPCLKMQEMRQTEAILSILSSARDMTVMKTLCEVFFSMVSTIWYGAPDSTAYGQII